MQSLSSIYFDFLQQPISGLTEEEQKLGEHGLAKRINFLKKQLPIIIEQHVQINKRRYIAHIEDLRHAHHEIKKANAQFVKEREEALRQQHPADSLPDLQSEREEKHEKKHPAGLHHNSITEEEIELEEELSTALFTAPKKARHVPIKHILEFVQVCEQTAESIAKIHTHLIAQSPEQQAQLLVEIGQLEENSWRTRLLQNCMPQLTTLREQRHYFQTMLKEICQNKYTNLDVLDLFQKKFHLNLSLREENDLSPFEIAIDAEHNPLLEFLFLDQKLPINDTINDEGKTPLTYALSHEKKDMVELLLTKYHADPELPDDSSTTPLEVALYNQDVSAVISLTFPRASANTADVNQVTSNNETYLALAIRYLRQDNVVSSPQKRKSIITIIHHFLMLGAKPNERWADGSTSLLSLFRRINSLLKDQNVAIQKHQIEKSNELELALKDLRELAIFMVSNGADIDQQDSKGQTPFSFFLHPQPEEQALFQKMKQFIVGLHATPQAPTEETALTELLNNPANQETPALTDQIRNMVQASPLLVNRTNKNGDSPLILALRRGFNDIALLLLDLHADPMQTNGKDNNPILEAVNTHNEDFLRKLHVSGINLDAQVRNGFSPLTFAISSCGDDIYMLKFLINEMNVNPYHKDGNGLNALAIAIDYGYRTIVSYLITPKTIKKWLSSPCHQLTPLTRAVVRNNHDLVELLLNRGANASRPDSRGILPLTPALVVQDKLIQELLTKKGAQEQDGLNQFSMLTLAHILGLGGKITCHQMNGFPYMLKLDGLHNSFSHVLFNESLNDYIAHLDKSPGVKLDRNYFNEARDSADMKTIPEVRARLDQQLPVILRKSFSNPSHMIGIVLENDTISICNRGAGTRTSGIITHRITPALLTEEQLNKLVSMNNLTDLDPFLKEIGVDLDNPLDSIPQKEQTVGNCSWASSKSAILAFLNLKLMQEIPDPQERHLKAKELYKQFTTFSRIFRLTTYLKSLIQQHSYISQDFVEMLKSQIEQNKNINETTKKQLKALLRQCEAPVQVWEEPLFESEEEPASEGLS